MAWRPRYKHPGNYYSGAGKKLRGRRGKTFRRGNKLVRHVYRGSKKIGTEIVRHMGYGAKRYVRDRTYRYLKRRY